MNTYCNDCGRCTGGCMRQSDVPGEGEDHNRCHECEGKLQSSISGLQSALAAETKRREEADERAAQLEKMVGMACDMLNKRDKDDCTDEFGDSGLISDLWEYMNGHDALQADNARLREALEKLRDMQIVETLPVIEAALAQKPGGAS